MRACTRAALLRVTIDGSGVVEEVAIVESDPSGHFEDDAKRAFMSARFTPAVRNGRAVKSRVLVHIVYGMGESSRSKYHSAASGAGTG